MTTQMYFPLGTSLELAQEGELDIVQRAKQASVLFDQLIVEVGMCQIEVSNDSRPMQRYVPPGKLTAASIDAVRRLESGTTAGLALRQLDDGRVEFLFGSNLPRLEGATYVEWEVAYRYIAEFHTPLLTPLAEQGADWLRAVSIGRDRGQGPRVTDAEIEPLPAGPASLEDLTYRFRLDAEAREVLGKALATQIETDPAGEQPSTTNALEGLMADNFAEAAQVAELFSATFNVTPAYANIASERGVPLSLPGEEGLRFFVPNLTALPWEAIAQFREHSAAKEARERLAAFEERALHEGQPGSPANIRATATQVTDCLVSAAQELAPSLTEDLRGPVLGTAVSIVPVVGQFLSLASSMGDLIAAVKQHQDYAGSWLAAIFELREEAIASLLDQ